MVRRRLLLLPWAPLGAPLWAEGVAGMDSDARKPLYLGAQQQLTLPDGKSVPKSTTPPSALSCFSQ